MSYTPTSTWNEGHSTTSNIDALIAESSRPTPAAQEDLILEHLPTVHFVARKLQRTLPAHIELEELVAAGMLGLVDAAARYQPESGILFSTFAQFRIRGAILDSLRDLDWAPRELRRKGRSVQSAIAQATQRTGRTPGEADVAAEMGLALSDYQVLLGELDGLEVGSLNIERGEGSDEEQIAFIAGSPEEEPLFHCLRGEMKQLLIDAIGNLPERERLVMTLYHYEELTMKEIGQVMSIAESRVSQIRSSAVLRLRTALAGLKQNPQSKSRTLKSAA